MNPTPAAASAVAEYLSQIKKNLAQGIATEHTHRSALQALIESVGKSVQAINEPKRSACGAPDLVIIKSKSPIGWVETKDIGVPLAEMVKGRGPSADQFKRYKSLPNWILTDYLEFRWYHDGEQSGETVRIAELDGKKLRVLPEGENKLLALLSGFMDARAATIDSAKDLARRLAQMTHIIRDYMIAELEHGGGKERKLLEQWLEAFRASLIPDLKQSDFADMFAQTLSYGLFAARVHTLKSDEPFTFRSAAHMLPRTNPFLRKLFHEIDLDLPETFSREVEYIVELLGKRTDFGKVLKDFGKGKGKEDPVVHFYETFLQAYDPKLRELRGVYYTPEPVVSYIVRSVDKLLQTHFGKSKGLADEKTLILDPAVGTATFLYFVIQQIRERLKKDAGAWDDYVSKHLLNRIFGFELLMAPYTVAHLKLGMELQETGYKFQSDERLGIYLTNTLEEAAKKSEKLFPFISEEANAAAEIKREKEIMVVLGNPPYSGHSANRSQTIVEDVVETKSGTRIRKRKEYTFIGRLMEDYKKNCPELHKPAQAKWLQDDYVKFIRFAEWRISKTGEGILGFITNNGYLDNPTFRGMRRNLHAAFNEIYVLDLHGSSKKKERAPGGEPDENVFDIQQGVAIVLAVKNGLEEHRIFHSELFGERAHKYGMLHSNDVSTTAWDELKATEPLFTFKPLSDHHKDEYDRGWSVADIFNQTGEIAPGIVTTHDEFAISFTREEAIAKVNELLAAGTEAEARARFRLCSTSQWNFRNAQAELKNTNWQDQIVPILYRPFDVRYTVYNRFVAVHRRDRVMRYMLDGKNTGFITTRLTKDDWDFFVAGTVIGHKALAAYDINYLLPEYVTKPETGDLFQVEQHPNLSPEFLAQLAERLGLEQDSATKLPNGTNAHEISSYIYGIFHSTQFRARYHEFLKVDFPRVPLTSKLSLFRRIAKLGAELVTIHLLSSPDLNSHLTEFPIKGSNIVDKVEYTPANGRVSINPAQYFSPVPTEIWNYHIGGYQVCEKWLKDRKGRKLTYDDIQHYHRIVVAISETIRLQKEIDAAIPGWPIE